jgi:hypothetical protein
MVDVFLGLIERNSSDKEIEWVNSKISTAPVTLFVAAHRFVSKKQVLVNTLFEEQGSGDVYWPLDRLVRVYALQKLNSREIDLLFETSELNETVALYSSLSFLANPSQWLLRATDAVRSNIGNVFDALAFQNSFPSKYFSELQWNQLVLKCIFNDKGIHQIWGLKERNNAALAKSISDFAHERWAAGRNVPAQVWRLVSDFVDDQILTDLESLWNNGREEDKIAVALVAVESRKTERFSTQIKEYVKTRTFSWSELE